MPGSFLPRFRLLLRFSHLRTSSAGCRGDLMSSPFSCLVNEAHQETEIAVEIPRTVKIGRFFFTPSLIRQQFGIVNILVVLRSTILYLTQNLWTLNFLEFPGKKVHLTSSASSEFFITFVPEDYGIYKKQLDVVNKHNLQRRRTTSSDERLLKEKKSWTISLRSKRCKSMQFL